MMPNGPFALQVIQALVKAGVHEFCVCPGARNSPLSALLLEFPNLRVFYHFDERSAAFFALGRIKATHRPVAVVTTSGTAVGELLPAAMEAHYTALPLVLVSADRPRSFRGSGAPQTAEQSGIFGIYAEKSLDLAAGEAIDLQTWSSRYPLHLNVCFDEPLLDGLNVSNVKLAVAPPAPKALPVSEKIKGELQAFVARIPHPLAIISSLGAQDRGSVRRFLLETRMPAYFEAQSGLREDPALEAQRVHVCDGLLDRAAAHGYPVDGVIRIGSVPTLRTWRDLEVKKLPVLSLSREPFSGLSGLKIAAQPINQVLEAFLENAPSARASASVFLKRDQAALAEMEALFKKYPRSEPALFRALSERLDDQARLFVGNSLPIREWDMAASFAPRTSEVAASRGLNGIDGQLSTFLGYCNPPHSNWAILGDLTALYDLSAPWILSQLPSTLLTTLVIVNNQGGKIFSRMFPQREFQNPHSIEFSSWAEMWSLPYDKWETVPSAQDRAIVDTSLGGEPAGARLRVIELAPDTAQTDALWRELTPIWKN
jgi:2-succinyl-5-enolpyruvyl-6-hydroxy-3-cyclohexene-1-carboxylate synthase